MPTREEMLAEAYSRGLLPPEKKQAYEEAQRRGLIGGGQVAPARDEAAGLDAGFERLGVSPDNPRRYEAVFSDPEREGAVGSAMKGVSQGAIWEHGAGTLQALSEGLRAMGFEDAAEAVWGQKGENTRELAKSDFERATADNPNIAQAGKLVGQFAPAIAAPGGVAGGVVKRALSGAAAGGGLGALEYVDEGEFRGDNALAGAAFGAAGGAVMTPVLKTADKAFRALLGKPSIRVFDDSGQITEEALSALDEAQRAGRVSADQLDDVIVREAVGEGVLTPEQGRRFNLFKRYGMEPTRANVTRSTDDWREVQEGVKRGGRIADTVSAQDARLAELGDEAIERIGPLTEDAASTNASVYGVVQRVADDADQKVSAAYTAAREAATDGEVVQPKSLIDVLKRNAGRENITGGVVSAARQELRNRGLLKGERAISVDESEEIRQVFNSFFDSAKPQGRALIRELKEALDDDVAAAVGEDVFTEARAARRELARIFGRDKANKFDRSKGKLLEQILDGTLPENRIMPKILSDSLDNRDLVKMKGFLTEDAGPEGAQAWLNLKGQVLRDAIQRATGTQARGEGGQVVFNSNKFQNAISKLKRSGKHDLLFNSSEQAFIDDLIELGELRIPNRAVAQGRGPSAFAVDEAKGAIVDSIVDLVPGGQKVSSIIDAVKAGRSEVGQTSPARQTEEFLRRR